MGSKVSKPLVKLTKAFSFRFLLLSILFLSMFLSVFAEVTTSELELSNDSEATPANLTPTFEGAQAINLDSRDLQANSRNFKLTSTSTIDFTSAGDYVEQDNVTGTSFKGGLVQLLSTEDNGVLTYNMTGPTSPSGEASASAVYLGTRYAWLAFDTVAEDGSGTKAWISDNPATIPAWLQYDFPSIRNASNYTLKGYDIGNSPQNWTLEGSNDNVTWVVLDTQSAVTWASSETYTRCCNKTFTISNPAYYLYYKLNITAVDGGTTYVGIQEMALEGETSFNDTQAFYVTTSNTSQVNTAGWDGIASVSFTETVPNINTSVKYLVSFDSRVSWVFWNDSASAWQNSNATLSDIEVDGMSSAAVANITQSQWGAAGGFVVGTLDFAVSLLTNDSAITPSLDQIAVTQADTASPTVTIEAPADNAANTTTNTIDFTYNVSDSSSLDNCTLIIQNADDISINITDTAMVNDTVGQNFTVYLDNSDYNWTVNCTDNSNNIGTASWRNISIQILPPTVTIESPDDNATNTTTNTIDFAYNVSGGPALSNCTLIIQNSDSITINVTDTTMTKDTAGQSFTSYLSAADYNWTVNCTDTINGIGTAGWRNISILGDITPPDIIFTDPTLADQASNPNASQEVNITITETNLQNITWNWNGTNYSIYDDDLILMLNLENYSVLGENETYAVDISKYSNNVTLKGGAAWATSGKYEGALEFDGADDYVDISSTVNSEPITITLWIRPKHSAGTLPPILEFGSASATALHLWQHGDGTNLYANYASPGNAFNTANGVVILNEWNFVVFTYNQSDALLYHNGIEVANKTWGDIDYSGYNLNLGARLNGAAYFNGTIDEVRIYNRTLTADEIEQQYYLNLQKYDIGKWSLYINESNLTTGNYTYFGTAIDTSNNENSTETRTLLSENTPPTVSLESPADNTSNLTTNTIDFTYNVSDDASSLDNCTLIIQNGDDTSINVTDTSMLMDTVGQNFTVYLGNGDYNWSVNCTDSMNNIGASGARNISIQVDTTSPTVILEAPDNDTTNITTNTIDFAYNVSDFSSLDNCSLIIQNAGDISINLTDTSMLLNTVGQNFTVYLDIGDYNWTVNCTDQYNNLGGAEWRNISILGDVVQPTVSLESPADNTTNLTTNTIDFLYNVSDTSALSNCTLIIQNGGDTSINVTDTAMLKDTASQNFTVYLGNGEYNWTVNCTDTVNNIGASGAMNISIQVDTTAPTVTIESPADNTANTTSTIDFTYNVTDFSSLGNCSLIIQNAGDISINVTDTAMLLDTAGQNFTVYLDNSDYNWTVNCTDQYNNLGSADWRNISIIRDITPPTVTIEAPADNATNTTTNTIDFTYNVSDTSSLSNCTLIIQNAGDISINVTDTSMANDTAGQNFTAYLDSSDYNWTINCTDTINNIGTSGIRNISLTYVAPAAASTNATTTPASSGGASYSGSPSPRSDETTISSEEIKLGNLQTVSSNTNSYVEVRGFKNRLDVKSIGADEISLWVYPNVDTGYFEPIKLLLKLASHERVDLDNDGIGDLWIELRSINKVVVLGTPSYDAVLFLKEMEQVTKESVEGEVSTSKITDEGTSVKPLEKPSQDLPKTSKGLLSKIRQDYLPAAKSSIRNFMVYSKTLFLKAKAYLSNLFHKF